MQSLITALELQIGSNGDSNTVRNRLEAHFNEFDIECQLAEQFGNPLPLFDDYLKLATKRTIVEYAKTRLI